LLIYRGLTIYENCYAYKIACLLEKNFEYEINDDLREFIWKLSTKMCRRSYCLVTRQRINLERRKINYLTICLVNGKPTPAALCPVPPPILILLAFLTCSRSDENCIIYNRYTRMCNIYLRHVRVPRNTHMRADARVSWTILLKRACACVCVRVCVCALVSSR